MDIPPVQVQMLGRFVIRRGSQEVSVSGRSQKLCLLLAALMIYNKPFEGGRGPGL